MKISSWEKKLLYILYTLYNNYVNINIHYTHNRHLQYVCHKGLPMLHTTDI